MNSSGIGARLWAKTSASSVVDEAFEYKEKLLDQIIIDIDDKAEQERVDNNEKLEQEKRLQKSGEYIHNMNLKRISVNNESTIYPKNKRIKKVIKLEEIYAVKSWHSCESSLNASRSLKNVDWIWKQNVSRLKSRSVRMMKNVVYKMLLLRRQNAKSY